MKHILFPINDIDNFYNMNPTSRPLSNMNPTGAVSNMNPTSRPVSNMNPTGAVSNINPITEIKPVYFYNNCSYSGKYIQLGEGDYDLSKPEYRQIYKNIYSIKIPIKYSVKIYDVNNKNVLFNDSISCLLNMNINNLIWYNKIVRVVIKKT